MITLKNVSKFYYNKGIIASGFSKINLKLDLGEFVAITGESGSGKSTLLNVISGLDSYEEGEMYIDGKETSHYTEIDFEKYRKKYISNIFQNFNLVNSYTVKQNVELVLLLNGYQKKEATSKSLQLIKEVGLSKYKNTKVSKLSGGQKQRVAIARALAKDTPIIIADEPTGNLDSRSAKGILELLHNITKDKLVVIVTHNYEQVAPYVTRKITMHDGKILEDKVLVPTTHISYQKEYKEKQISFLNELIIGIRNAFNIFPKFILVLMVYLFITLAVTSEYSFFKRQEYETSQEGYNQFFINTKDTRLIVKKNDKTPFTEEDYSYMMNLEHVDSIEKNDLLLDNNVYITDFENMYFDGMAKDVSNFKGKISVGTMPKNDNEILLVGPKDNYYLGELKEQTLGLRVALDIEGGTNSEKKYQIVGIAYIDGDELTNLFVDGYVYGTSGMVENLQFSINEHYSELNVFFNNQYHTSNFYEPEYRIIPNNNVNEGGAYVTEEWNLNCNKNNCLNEQLGISVKNIYYNDNINLKVSKLYNGKNMDKLLGVKEYSKYNGAIYINTKDYSKLFSHGNYQSTVFADDVKNVDSLSQEIEAHNMSVLKMRDAIETIELIQILKIVRTVITIILIVALFFISYFVIRIILKSRNIYFGTIRILGATKQNAKHLLEIELLTVSNIAYIFFILLLCLYKNKIIQLSFLNTIVRYLSVREYIMLYIVITLMSYLISIRFSRKIFKNSAMNTMREEV